MGKHKIIATCYDKRGRRLSRAQNSYRKTHPLQAHFAKLVGSNARQYLHAEIAAILGARHKRIHSIHVERYGADGRPRMAAPCPICRKAIEVFQIKRITYT